MLKFTEEHEWLMLDGDVATVGITPHASQQLGDLVFVELPKVGAKLKKAPRLRSWNQSRPRPTCTPRSTARLSKSIKRRWMILQS